MTSFFGANAKFRCGRGYHSLC